ncbi:hypothetical protein P152DRAFT_236851 [Eremomyces bilateralis CBS 781.70]|uniref:C3H1-type domain-containing protein n=1 Tax=Eremomyces bilateralis CBS 781.70 TaxID=1392243 RepID=A0A6G1GA56_9PEZI|nr:uncharacterized protein P152DRAFT_236851 [Eremomyces bilateralis CBS 781.70]KAF1814882.1 hypothetical protein P152DRAFT_236851 [Eremomyces bilateralis CBS 781.70]
MAHLGQSSMASPLNGHSAGSFTTASQAIHPQMAPEIFRQKIEELLRFENDKQRLMLEMLRHCENAAEMSYDLEREREHNRNSQKKIRDLERQLAEKDDATTKSKDKLSMELRMLRDRDPFVLILLDGDGIVFADELLAEGEDGGRKAAGLFESQIRDFLEQSPNPNLSSIPHARIVCRLYVSMKSFSEVCYRAGLASRPEIVEQFFRGFTKSKLLFDSIDVGHGKDRADEKIRENFKLNLFDPHCRQIILGCSHDNGYRRLLEDYESDEGILARVTLLEGVPFEFELKSLPFNKIKFGSIFRSNKIVAPSTLPTMPIIRKESMTPPTATPSPEVAAANLASKSRVPSWATAAATTTPAAPSSSNGVPLGLSKSAQSQQFTAGSDPPRSQSPPPIRRNKYRERLDPPFHITDKAVYDHVKGLRLCNQYFLNGQCYKEECRNRHDYKPTPRELNMLRLVARTMPCFQGADCEDPWCLTGHHCQNENGPLGHCPYGSKCKFYEMHGMDKTPVATVKIGS